MKQSDRNPLIGQEPAIELMKCALSSGRISTAYLFVGPDGVGKSKAARIFVESIFREPVSSNHPDLLWVEPTYLHQGELYTTTVAREAGLTKQIPPQVRINQIREITKFLSHPTRDSRLIVVIEQAETMADVAANALLKTLEEPGPAKTLILLAPSTELLLPTLVSRCTLIPFKSLSATAMRQVLMDVARAEVLEHPILLKMAAGSPGKAIESMQQLESIPTEILGAVSSPPDSFLKAMELAAKIDKELEVKTQLWLIEYLQHLYWEQWSIRGVIEKLELHRQQLLNHAQSKLVWEVMLSSLLSNFELIK